MKKLSITMTLALTVALTGCAMAPRGAAYVPLVDMQGHSPEKFAGDTRDCQAYAATRMSELQGVLSGALAGGLLGAALAPKGYRNRVANYGATAGALGGGARANDTQESITRRCIAGRGYNVLD